MMQNLNIFQASTLLMAPKKEKSMEAARHSDESSYKGSMALTQ
jgi:hypothetical protein